MEAAASHGIKVTIPKTQEAKEDGKPFTVTHICGLPSFNICRKLNMTDPNLSMQGMLELCIMFPASPNVCQYHPLSWQFYMLHVDDTNNSMMDTMVVPRRFRDFEALRGDVSRLLAACSWHAQ